MKLKSSPRPNPSVLALSGGVGGAKLALGLYRVLDPWDLAIAINTGDDFSHIGLPIAPDIDTIMYTLSGESNAELGWGRTGETWNFMEQFGRLGGEKWFNLGDGDLAVHMRRLQLLQAGESLSAITDQFFQAHGIAAHALPASDDPVRTMIHAADGRQLIFQNYFVEERCKPEVRDFTYAGATSAVANPGIIAALRDPALRAVVLCPSNPFVSINPILAVPGIRDALCACPAPIVGVSPIVGGAAIKGPLAKMFYELGQPANCTSVLDHYRDFLTGFIVDHADAEEAKGWDIPTCVTSTIMKTLEDRDALAVAALEFAGELARHDRK